MGAKGDAIINDDRIGVNEGNAAAAGFGTAQERFNGLLVDAESTVSSRGSPGTVARCRAP